MKLSEKIATGQWGERITTLEIASEAALLEAIVEAANDYLTKDDYPEERLEVLYTALDAAREAGLLE
jgi:hypothetical protein